MSTQYCIAIYAFLWLVIGYVARYTISGVISCTLSGMKLVCHTFHVRPKILLNIACSYYPCLVVRYDVIINLHSTGRDGST
jgi:hypothetical protein